MELAGGLAGGDSSAETSKSFSPSESWEAERDEQLRARPALAVA